MQTDGLRSRIFRLEAEIADREVALTEDDFSQVRSILTNLSATWRTMPTSAKGPFEQLVCPVGYAFRTLRTAETGLLFKTCEGFEESQSTLVHRLHEGSNKKTSENPARSAFIRDNIQGIIAEIRKLLTIVRNKETPVQRPD